jgi:hypothetical protein
LRQRHKLNAVLVSEEDIECLKIQPQRWIFTPQIIAIFQVNLHRGGPRRTELRGAESLRQHVTGLAIHFMAELLGCL